MPSRPKKRKRGQVPQNDAPEESKRGQVPQDDMVEKTKMKRVATEESLKKTKENITDLTPKNPAIFTEIKFESLPIDTRLKNAIQKQLHLEVMTQIQAQTIHPLLKGKDLLGKARTGSGKTLAFLLPAIQQLIDHNFNPKKGVGVLILSPTRELAIQIHNIAENLLKDLPISSDLVIGGTNQNAEGLRLAKGVNLLIATPGRLLDHLQSQKRIVINNLKCLIFDEADRLLDAGFERDIMRIIALIPRNRQTVLFSATQRKNVQDLVRLAFRTQDPFNVDVDKENPTTVEGLDQAYLSLEAKHKPIFLLTFLKQNHDKKIIVFFGTCKSVKFYTKIFNTYLDCPVLSLFGQQAQKKRTQTFFAFKEASKGVLFSTDVSARGFDIPAVHHIIQFDPPTDPKEYVHRVGRTARAGNKGSALLLLLPQELTFLDHLKTLGVKNISNFQLPLNDKDYCFNSDKIATLKNIDTISELGTSACHTFLRFYVCLKHFSVQQLCPVSLAEQFFVDNSQPIKLLIDKYANAKCLVKGKKNKG